MSKHNYENNDYEEPYTVFGKKITPEHTQFDKCGKFASYYKVGHYGFNTACMIKKWFPEMYKDSLYRKIADTDNPIMPGNFKLAFTENVNYTWGKPSNMWCSRCDNYKVDKACEWKHGNDKAESMCLSAYGNCDKIYAHNFFAETECPNLISKEVHLKKEPQEIYVKLVEPIVLYSCDYVKVKNGPSYTAKYIVKKNGEVTDQLYDTCKKYINSNFRDDGTVVENSCNKSYSKKECEECKKCTEALEGALWIAKDSIKLKIPAEEEARSYSLDYDNVRDIPISEVGIV